MPSLVFCRPRMAGNNSNFLEAAKKYLHTHYKNLSSTFKNIKLSGEKVFRLRFKKDNLIKTEEIIDETIKVFKLQPNDIAAEIESKYTCNIFVYEKTGISKVENKYTTVKIRNTEIKIVSTKWYSFKPIERKKPPFSFTMRGYVGNELDLKRIINTFGISTKIHRDKNVNGTYNGKVFVEFSKINNPDFVKLDYIELSDNSNIFIQWYKEGIRIIGYTEENFKNINNNSNIIISNNQNVDSEDNIGKTIMEETIDEIMQSEILISPQQPNNSPHIDSVNNESSDDLDDTSINIKQNINKKTKKTGKYSKKSLPEDSQKKKRKREKSTPKKSKNINLNNTPEDIIVSSQEDTTPLRSNIC